MGRDFTKEQIKRYKKEEINKVCLPPPFTNKLVKNKEKNKKGEGIRYS